VDAQKYEYKSTSYKKNQNPTFIQVQQKDRVQIQLNVSNMNGLDNYEICAEYVLLVAELRFQRDIQYDTCFTTNSIKGLLSTRNLISCLILRVPVYWLTYIGFTLEDTPINNSTQHTKIITIRMFKVIFVYYVLICT